METISKIAWMVSQNLVHFSKRKKVDDYILEKFSKLIVEHFSKMAYTASYIKNFVVYTLERFSKTGKKSVSSWKLFPKSP